MVKMKSARAFCLVLVTVPSRETARQLARKTLRARLAACVNLVPAVESHYWWQGRLEHAREILLLIKTTRANLAQLERLILDQHPYHTPEFLALPLESGSARYLEWLTASVARSRTNRATKPST
jgi:periplasmic divalent cation tolerance protein